MDTIYLRGCIDSLNELKKDAQEMQKKAKIYTEKLAEYNKNLK